MSISAVQERTTLLGGSNVSTLSIPFGSNVTAGNLCVVAFAHYCDPALTPLAAHLTKASGTATIGTIALDVQRVVTAPQDQFSVAIYSFPITGSGSLTMTWGTQSGSYPTACYGEYASTVGWSATAATRLEASNSVTANSAAVDSGNGTSAGEALFFGVATDARPVSQTTTQDGAFTLLYENEDPTTYNTASFIRRIVSTGTTDSASWTISTPRPYAAALAVYKETGGGGGSSILRQMMAHH
jgi:hypothetical protein